jgi:hypothetical protein
LFRAPTALISHALYFASAFSARENTLVEKPTALKLCKQEQAVEESVVSCERDPIFHTLINTCVENLISQKYYSSSSA